MWLHLNTPTKRELIVSELLKAPVHSKSVCEQTKAPKTQTMSSICRLVLHLHTEMKQVPIHLEESQTAADTEQTQVTHGHDILERVSVSAIRKTAFKSVKQDLVVVVASVLNLVRSIF